MVTIAEKYKKIVVSASVLTKKYWDIKEELLCLDIVDFCKNCKSLIKDMKELQESRESDKDYNDALSSYIKAISKKLTDIRSIEKSYFKNNCVSFFKNDSEPDIDEILGRC